MPLVLLDGGGRARARARARARVRARVRARARARVRARSPHLEQVEILAALRRPLEQLLGRWFGGRLGVG